MSSNNSPPLSTLEVRRARQAGNSAGLYARKLNSRLDVAIAPDESGAFRGQQKPGTAATSGSVLGAVYLGRATGGKVLDYISVVTTVAGTGTVGAVVAFGTTATGPDFTAKDITIRAVQELDTVNGGTGAKTNTTRLDYRPAAGDHVWALYCSTNGTTNATLYHLTGDSGQGSLQRKLTVPANTVLVGTTFTMSLLNPSLQVPTLFVR